MINCHIYEEFKFQLILKVKIVIFECPMNTVISVHLKLQESKDVGLVKYFGLSVLVAPDFTLDKSILIPYIKDEISQQGKKNIQYYLIQDLLVLPLPI